MTDKTDYSTRRISPRLIAEIKRALKNLDYGSVELYVTNGVVCQITKRQIRKTVSEPQRKGKNNINGE